MKRPDPNNLVLRIDPKAGARVRLQAKGFDGLSLRTIHLDMDFADEGGEGHTPYEELLNAAMHGDQSHFARQDSVEETWRIMEPLVEKPPPVDRYEQGTWGPAAADRLTTGYGGWHDPWITKAD